MKHKDGKLHAQKDLLSNKKNHSISNGVEIKPKRKNKCDLGANFVAPDGGWGWLVLIGAGCSNLFTFPVLQQFGLLFRERLESIGLSTAEITTIINLNPCITSCSGLLNGPMFRCFTYRQVALFGATLVAFAVYLTSISNSFITYLITFSILYGAGSGINSSANSLALNTYFKEKRRIATGLSWTLTGMGPILFPQIIAVILPYYGIQGTLLLFTGIALNAIVCACLFQPVQWHVKHPANVNTLEENLMNMTSMPECDYCQMMKRRNHSLISSQYLYNADNASATGYEIIDPGVPMLSVANDGWSSRRSMYGSRSSLYSDRASRIGSRKPSSQNLVGLNRSSSINLVAMAKERKRKISDNKIEEHPEDSSSKNSHENVDTKLKINHLKTPDIRIADSPDVKYFINDTQSALTINKATSPRRKISTSNNFNVEKEVLKNVSEKLEEFVVKGDRVPTVTSLEGYCTCEEKLRLHLDPTLGDEHDNEVIEEENMYQNMNCMQRALHKIVVFFDLDLLRDLTYVNLMMGVTLGNFAELNFSLLTPFFLAEWGFNKTQIATAMSLLGGVDLSIRFFIPFIAGKIGWENKTFFLIGIFGMAMGRVFITFYRTYTAILAAFVWIGFGKGLRTVFMALVIPSHVPLHRLPAASGLQLVFAGIFYFFVGPLVGYVRDKTDYVTTLHFLNLCTYFVTICWLAERFYRNYQQRSQKVTEPDSLCPSAK